MLKNNSKRGELTTQQIVTLVILIVSFIIILIFIFLLDLGGTTDAEICRNSVVLRGNSVVPGDAVGLDCGREYLCITKDGSCEGLTNPEVKKVDNLEGIYGVVAEEMRSCWWMFGEGKVKYIDDAALKRNHCSICDQILFDDSLEELLEGEVKISKDALYDYLATNNMVGKENTYAEYFFGTNNVEKLKLEAMQKTGQEGLGTFGDIEVGKQYFVVMGITSEVNNFYKWAGGVGAVAGVVLLFPASVPTVVGVLVLATGVTAIAGGGEYLADQFTQEILALTVKGDGIDNQFMAPTIVEAESDRFRALNCEDIITFS
ncbi:MAG: hypothetical protein KKB31_00285 [Nanoarchaeota archaeon]|nr:hypothetical protein [Nanoarchaeota archaeon]